MNRVSFGNAALKLATAMAVIAGLACGQTGAQEPLPEGPGATPVVVELFTSQACTACPPADELMAGLAQRPDIIAISWPVDIWDYLGWEDTLAYPDSTRRQAQYNGRFGLRWPYTPEVVINGRTHVPGNQPNLLERQISEQRQASWITVPIRANVSEDRLVIHVGDAPDELVEQLGTVWLVPYRTHENVEITGGPNAGRVATYTNVAEGHMPISQWAGTPVILRHELDYAPGEMPDGFAILLQKHRNGPIIGAARVEISQ